MYAQDPNWQLSLLKVLAPEFYGRRNYVKFDLQEFLAKFDRNGYLHMSKK